MTRSTLPLLTLLGLLSAAATTHCAPSPQVQDLGQQLVFGGNDASAPTPASSAPSRQPDFIDSLQAEAEAQGIKLDLGLDHLAQKAQEEKHRAAHAAVKQPHADKLLESFGETVEEWSSLILPDSDVEEIEDIKAAASHAAEMYASTDSVAEKVSFGHFKMSKSGPASTKGEPGSGWVWQSCALENEAVSIDSIDVTPDPPKPGKNMTVRGKGVVKSLIDEGSYVDVVVKLGLIKLLSRRFDLCEEARGANASVQCPLEPGVYDVEQTVALPREIPPAKFNVHVTGQTQDEVDLMCLDLSINFMHI